MGLQRWFYGGGPPNRGARILDRRTAALSARRVTPEYLAAALAEGSEIYRVIGTTLILYLPEKLFRTALASEGCRSSCTRVSSLGF